jgi:4-hydroxy-4-methyl-2-oxoglutarate aldolase
MLWKNDEELFSLAKKELFSAVVGDILDTMGLTRQFLPPEIKPIDPKMVVIGRVMPVLGSDCLGSGDENTGKSGVSRYPFGYMMDALDDLKPGEVYVCAGASGDYALWGGLMSTRARHLGAAGAVLDGYWRDTKEVLALDYPCFGVGAYAQDQGPRGRVVDWRLPVQIGQVAIHPGDIIYGDLDGVLVIPKKAEKEAFSLAIEKNRGEKKVAEAIKNGMSAREAFDTFGIL